MAKKRTGLQCNISSIFSQVPVPKKGNKHPASSSSESQSQGPDSSQLTAPKQQAQEVLLDKHTAESHQRITSNLVREIKVPEERFIQILTKKGRRRRNEHFRTRTNTSSKRQRLGLALFFILFSILVAVLVRNFSIYSHGAASFDTADQPISQAFVTPNIEIKWSKPSKYPSDLRDPMELQEFERPDLIVRGIVTIEGSLFAIVDEQLVAEGEIVKGAKVVKIEPKTVRYEINGTKWTEAKTSDLVVKGIVVGEDRPKALIGIKAVEEGKEIFGVTVVRISRSSVEFEMDGKRWTQEVEGDKK